MWRISLIVVLLLIPGIRGAESDTSALPRSRIMAEILQRYGAGYTAFCLVGLAVSEKFKYSRIPLPPSFYERFIDGQFDAIEINPSGCPALAGEDDACSPSCGLIMLFDMAALGHPTPWDPWPDCTQERVTFSQGLGRPPGKIVMILNVHREIEAHHHLTVVETGPCDYLVDKEMVIE